MRRAFQHAPKLTKPFQIRALSQNANTRVVETTSHEPPRLLPDSMIPPRRLKTPAISTLSRKKLRPSDCLDLSDKQWPAIHTYRSLRAPVAERSPATMLGYGSQTYSSPPSQTPDRSLPYYVQLRLKKLYDQLQADKAEQADVEKDDEQATLAWQLRLAFPPNTRGFIYYYQPSPESNIPLFSSGIRFRCLPPEIPQHLVQTQISRHAKIQQAFKDSSDLLLPSGVPWHINIILISGSPVFRFVRQQLIDDGLVSEEQMARYEDIFNRSRVDRRSIIISSLEELIPVRFDVSRFGVWVVSEERPGRCIFVNSFTDLRKQYGGKQPYSGAALVRIELAPSTLSQTQPVLNLRVVKIIEPVRELIPSYDHYVSIPREGGLVTKGFGAKREPWSVGLSELVGVHTAMLNLIPEHRRGYKYEHNPEDKMAR